MLRLMILTLLACSAVAADKKPERVLTDEEKQTAYNVAVNWISARLKAPSTAHFAPISEAVFSDGSTHVIRPKDWAGAVSVRLYVDAQNSYGAMLRGVWNCRVGRERPDGLHLVACMEQSR